MGRTSEDGQPFALQQDESANDKICRLADAVRRQVYQVRKAAQERLESGQIL